MPEINGMSKIEDWEIDSTNGFKALHDENVLAEQPDLLLYQPRNEVVRRDEWGISDQLWDQRDWRVGEAPLEPYESSSGDDLSADPRYIKTVLDPNHWGKEVADFFGGIRFRHKSGWKSILGRPENNLMEWQIEASGSDYYLEADIGRDFIGGNEARSFKGFYLVNAKINVNVKSVKYKGEAEKERLCFFGTFRWVENPDFGQQRDMSKIYTTGWIWPR